MTARKSLKAFLNHFRPKIVKKKTVELNKKASDANNDDGGPGGGSASNGN